MQINSKNNVNTQIDSYIKDTIYKYIRSNDMYIENKADLYEAQRIDAEDFISKLSIYSN